MTIRDLTPPQRPAVQRSPLARMAAAQALAALGLGVWALVLDGALAPHWLAGTPAVLWLAGQGAIAAAISRALGLGWGWVGVQLALPAVAWGMLVLNLPSWVYLVAFTVLAGLYSNTLVERVPLYLTNRTTWQAVEGLLENEGGRFVDLGAGLGGMLAFLAGRHKDWRFEGVETAPLVFALAWLRLKLSSSAAGVTFKSLWNEDLSEATVVYAFLSPAPMARLLDKAAAEMKPGSLFISNSFWANADQGGVDADRIIEVGDGRKTRLYVKRF